MQKHSILTALTLAALTAATLSTAAFADRRGGADMGMRGPMASFDFAAVDADKDGKITKEESKTHSETMKKKWKEKREELKAGDVPPPAAE